jgi:hypothetical protein
MYPYISNSDIEAYLQKDLTTAQENAVALLIPLLQSLIDTYCGRTWDFTNPVTETFDAGTNVFFVSKPNITAINSVTIGGQAWELSSAFNYKTHVRLSTSPGGLFLPNPSGLQSVTISYNSDAAQNVPKPIKLAFLEWISRKLKAAPAGGREVVQTQAGSVSVRYSEEKVNEIPDFVKMVLDVYRLTPVG